MFRFLRKKSTSGGEKPNMSRIPRHVAIIMDGNGRWAKRRGMPRSAGHAAGAETFRDIANYCKELGMDYLTVYAFSTENWKRSQEEVGGIMRLLEKYLDEAIDSMVRDGNRLKILGDVSRLSPELRRRIDKTEELNRQIEGFQANLCVNYGGRDEILRGVKSVVRDIKEGIIGEEDVTEELFSSKLYTAGIPDPELIIRPSGEERLSNFLLWQCAYSEFWFSDVMWPDFTRSELDKALAAYQRRDRRFGGV